MALPDPIRRTLLSDEVAASIRRSILTGELQPGRHIRQGEWAAILGVSRMPVRDAIAKLESEGLVVVSRSNEASVATLTREDVLDAYLLNANATGMAAARAATRISSESMAALRRSHELMEQAVSADEIDMAERHNWEFHRILNRACGSRRLIAFLRVLSGGIPHFAVTEIEEWRRRAVCDHAELVTAVSNGEAEVARAVMESHVLTAADYVLEFLEFRGFWSHSDNPSS